MKEIKLGELYIIYGDIVKVIEMKNNLIYYKPIIIIGYHYIKAWCSEEVFFKEAIEL